MGAFSSPSSNQYGGINGASYGTSRQVYFNASDCSDRYSDTATEVNPLYQSCLFYVRY